MTRFLATADLHIGAGADYADDRLADQEGTLDQILELARAAEADTILIAGDVFHRPKPTPAELHVFARFTRQLERSGVPAIAILGNAGHDQLGTDQPSALELFADGEWLRVSRYPELIRAAGDVAVCTLPSVPVGRLVAARGGRDDTNETAAALLLDTAAQLRADVPDGWPAILLGHWSVTGASLPNGLPTTDLHEPVLPLEQLEQLGFDAIVLGHIHNAGIFGRHPDRPVFYTGSPTTLNFGEAHVDHGAWILDTDSGMNPEFVPLVGRRFVTVDADLTDSDMVFEHDLDETDVIAAAVTEQFREGALDNAVVRIRYRCTEEQHRRVDAAALKGFCLEAGAHRVYQVTPEIVRASRARLQVVDEQLAPQSALELWCDAQQLDEVQRRSAHALLGRYLEAVGS